MRTKFFLRKELATGEVDRIPFMEAHYKEAGVSYSPAAGMPILESFQLVNRWNLEQDNQAFVYAV